MSSDPKAFTRKWLLANHSNPVPFHSSKFDTVFSSQTIQKHVEDLKNSIDIEVYVSSRILPEDNYIDLEIFSHKHPHIPINLSRVILPHSCNNNESNVLMFVKDLRIARGKLAHPDRTISHYETIFRNNSIDQRLITFMPLSQLLNGYAGCENRRKLLFMYEQFIVDQDIAVKVNAFLGTKILHDGRAAFPIDLNDQLTLADKVHKALRMVFYTYSQPHGNQESKSVIRVGRHSMANEQIVENIIDLLYQLQEIHPRGCNNVSKLVIRANSNVGKAVQIYEDNSLPSYPPKSDSDDKTDGTDIDESLLQKIYVPTSIIPSDNIILDKEEDTLNETRRDYGPTIHPTQQQTSPQKPNVANLEQQLVAVLKQFVAKSKPNMNNAVIGGNVATANRMIRRRRVPANGNNRNGRKF